MSMPAELLALFLPLFLNFLSVQELCLERPLSDAYLPVPMCVRVIVCTCLTLAL